MSKEAKMFSTFLQALAQGHARVIEVEIDPNLPINAQIEAQLEAHLKDAEVRHRETCPACAAAHEKEQAVNSMSKPAESAAVPAADALAKRHYMETEELTERQVRERRESGLFDERATGMRPEMAAPYGTEQTPPVPKARLIGFMAFDGDKPIDKTFDTDRDTVEQGIERFLKDPMTQMMRAFTNGAGFPDLKIKSIFTRDDL